MRSTYNDIVMEERKVKLSLPFEYSVWGVGLVYIYDKNADILSMEDI